VALELPVVSMFRRQLLPEPVDLVQRFGPALMPVAAMSLVMK
jgi:hypothetical protein